MDNNDYNDKGFKFIPDITMTKYVQEEKYMSDGHIQKGIPGMLVLNVYHKENGHVTNLLYNTKTQTPVDEIPLGEPGWCKLDMIRLAYEMNEKESQ